MADIVSSRLSIPPREREAARAGEGKVTFSPLTMAGAKSVKNHQGQIGFNRTEDMASVCKHPRVRIVSRHDDIEFVECLECGEIFDSEEFRDMEIEETVEAQPGDGDS